MQSALILALAVCAFLVMFELFRLASCFGVIAVAACFGYRYVTGEELHSISADVLFCLVAISCCWWAAKQFLQIQDSVNE